MSNPLIQNAGYTFSSKPSGIIGTAPGSGTGNTHTSTTVDTLNFNPQTTGPAAGNLRKGSLVELGGGGHAPDILVTVATSASITILTATSSTVTGTAVTAFNFPALISGEASAVTNGNTLLSSYFVGDNGTGGVLDQNDFSNAVYCDLVFIAGGAFTPTAGGYLAGWFMESEDGGTSFEKNVANTAPPRAPDFILPLFAAAYAAGDRAWAKGVLMPSCPCKILIQNNAGVTLPSTWGVWALPEGVQLTT